MGARAYLHTIKAAQELLFSQIYDATKYARPWFLVKQSDGGVRACADLSEVVGNAGDVVEIRHVGGAAGYSILRTRGDNTDAELVGLILRYS